jgi:hypothetical protein
MRTLLHHRRLLSLAALTSIAVVAAASPVSARPSPAAVPVIVGQLHTGCLTVSAAPVGHTVRITQRRAGKKLATASFVAVDQPTRVCGLKPMLAGDVLTVAEISDGITTSRKVTVPALTIVVDPVADTMRMTVPAPSVIIGFQVTPLAASLATVGPLSNGQTDGEGRFTWDPGRELAGAFGRVSFVGATEAFDLVDGSPSLAATAGSATVRGTGSYGEKVSVRLTSSTGKLKATAKATIGPGAEPRFTATLKNANGARVKAAPGDRISLSTIPNKRFTVRPSSLQVDPNSGGGGSLSATCVDREAYVIHLDGASMATGTVGDDGSVTLDPIVAQPGPLPVGSKVQVGCENASGLGQLMTVVTK